MSFLGGKAGPHAIASERLAHAWAHPNAYVEVAESIRQLVPGSQVALLGWSTPKNPHVLGGTTQRIYDGTDTDWAHTEAIVKHRVYSLDRPGRFGNRVVDARRVAKLSPYLSRSFQMFRDMALTPLGFGPFLRAPLYGSTGLVCLCGIMRSIGDTHFTDSDIAKVQSIVPALVDGIDARVAMETQGLAAGCLASVADAIAGPAFIVAGGGPLLYANAIARKVYETLPAWLPSCASERDDVGRPAWVKRVPLVLNGKLIFLLMPKERGIDPTQAHDSRWARRWRLPRRLAQVGALIAQGLSDKEIANQLGLSPDTARTYAKRTLSQTGVRRRSELAALICWDLRN